MITVEKEVLEMVFYHMYDERKMDSMNPGEKTKILKKCDAFTAQLPKEVRVALKQRILFSPNPCTKEEVAAFVAKYDLTVV